MWRNVVGIVLAASGGFLVALAFSMVAALITVGVILFAGSLFLVIDWDEA